MIKRPLSLPLLNRNLIFLTALSLLWAWQLMLAASWIFGYWPASSPLASQLLPEWKDQLQPEWKTVIYHLVILAALAFQSVLLWLNRRSLENKKLWPGWNVYLAIEAALTFLWAQAAFKKIVYARHPELAGGAFIVLMVLAVLCKIFAPECRQGLPKAWDFCLKLGRDKLWGPRLAWLMPLFVCALIYVPNVEAVVARNFIGEQFHHNDSFIMGPGWSHLCGQIPDVDIISQYGIGFIVVISHLAQFLGRYSYEHVMAVMIMGTLVYYLAWYFLLRQWLGSVLLTLVVVLWGIKIQMFHPGVHPFVFTYGSATPMRYYYDVWYFWFLFRHIMTRDKKWLMAAGAVCGFGIYYFTSEGLYGTASYLAYGILLAAFPYWRKYFNLKLMDAWLILLPFAAALLFLYMTIGGHLFTGQFWSNFGEFIGYFTSGFGLEPMYKTLLDHKYLESLMGFAIPVFYVFSLLIFLGRMAFNTAEPAEWMAVVLCFYGLGTFHYFVARSTGTSYYTVGLPIAFIAGYWIKLGLNVLKENKRIPVLAALLALVLWALFTNRMFLAYPNIFNLSSHPMTDLRVAQPLQDGRPYFNHLFRDFNPALKLPVNSSGTTDEELLEESDFTDDKALVDYYKQASNFAKDAQLIDSLTASNEQVPLISGFETEILMQANRRPFFYYYPLIITRPMKMRSFEVCSIYTTTQLAKTIAALEQTKPAYVFMERIYMIKEIPEAFLFQYPSLIPLVNYVRTHYVPVAQGEYLIALKRVS